MKKFSSKIMATIIAFILISIVSISLLFYFRAKYIINRISEENLLNAVNANAVRPEAEIDGVIRLSMHMENIIRNNGDREQIENEISAAVHESGQKSGWVIFDPKVIKGGGMIGFQVMNGKLIRFSADDAHALGLDKPIRQTNAYRNGEDWTKPYHVKYWGEDVITYSRRIEKNDRVIGLAGGEFFVDDIRTEINKLRLSDAGYYVLLDSNFNMIYQSDKHICDLDTVRSNDDKALAAKISKDEKKADVVYYLRDGQKEVMAYAKLTNGWILAAFPCRQEMFMNLHELKNTVVIIAFIILLMGFAVSYFLAKSMTAQIVYIKNAALEMAGGNLDAHIKISSKDEIGLLAEAFESMAANIKQKQSELIQHNEVLEKINIRLHDEIDKKNSIQLELNLIQEELEEKVKERTHELQLANEKLYEMSLIDGLTGVANRRYFDEFYDKEWHRALREQETLSIIMIDVDHFKLYNDAYGHQVGDDCLRIIGEALKDSLRRDTDLVARYGGEEFVVVLPNTDFKGAFDIAESIRSRIENLKMKHSMFADRENVTVSLGVIVDVPAMYSNKKDFLKAADNALYEAKRRGRNCIVMAERSSGS